jgi:hypothetical protein
MSSIAVATEIQKKSRKRRSTNLNVNDSSQSGQGEEKMTPTAQQSTTGAKTKKIQWTVFDLGTFDDVKLLKEVAMPDKPADLESAVNLIGNTDRLLELIYTGMCDEATEQARKVVEGWKVADEDNEPGEDYTGKFADEAKGKLIGNAVLTLAKLNGYDKSLPKEKKDELKEKAKKFLRDNPAMIQGMQG